MTKVQVIENYSQKPLSTNSCKRLITSDKMSLKPPKEMKNLFISACCLKHRNDKRRKYIIDFPLKLMKVSQTPNKADGNEIPSNNIIR